jgi:predicted Zn-dependent protease
MAAAERSIKEATTIELTLDAPSGPAEPIQPSFEIYGQMLLETNRAAEAAEQFQASLKRMPNRRFALDG